MVFCLCMKYLGEPLNGLMLNSHGRRVWSLAQRSLKVKVKGQGRQGQKRHFSALSVACVWFVFGRTSLTSSFLSFQSSCCGQGYQSTWYTLVSSLVTQSTRHKRAHNKATSRNLFLLHVGQVAPRDSAQHGRRTYGK